MNREAWLRIRKAMKTYEFIGFKYVDVPWLVDQEISWITKPCWCNDFPVQDKVLVGSAEQSFLQIYDTIDDGLYYAITPCYRDEVEDDLHQVGFLKLELFSKDVSKLDLIQQSAFAFFLTEIPLADYDQLELVQVGDNHKDINYKGVELGSYYQNSINEMNWVCGTGLAEPRFSKVLQI